MHGGQGAKLRGLFFRQRVAQEADQILELDHPEVKVINLPKRFWTLGEKMNTAVGGEARP